MKKNGRRGGNQTRNSYTAGGGILDWQTEAAENSGSRAKKMSSKGLDLTGDGPLVPNCRIEARQTKTKSRQVGNLGAHSRTQTKNLLPKNERP
jgi:hypothetical protein